MTDPYRQQLPSQLDLLMQSNAALQTRLRFLKRAGLIVLAIAAMSTTIVAACFGVGYQRRVAREHRVAVNVRFAPDKPADETIRGGWADGFDVYAVGENGSISHRDSTGIWTHIESGTTRALNSISMFGDNDSRTGFAVGDDGTILRFDASTRGWKSEASGTHEDLLGVAVSWPAIIAVGRHGTILYRESWNESARWLPMNSTTREDLHGIFISPFSWNGAGRTTYVVGDNGTILTQSFADLDAHLKGPVAWGYNELTLQKPMPPWKPQVIFTKKNLLSVGGAADDVFVGGADGTLLHSIARVHGPWTLEQSGAQSDLVSVAYAYQTVVLGKDIHRAPVLYVGEASGDALWLDLEKQNSGFHKVDSVNGAHLSVVVGENHWEYRADPIEESVYLFDTNGSIIRGVPYKPES